MARQDPSDTTILQLLRADLAGESPIRFIENVLSRNFDALAEVFAGEEEVESWWGDNNLFSTTTVSNLFSFPANVMPAHGVRFRPKGPGI